ncbi:hypothetical protein [Pseudomonas sp.]|uniref:hypothetical protein n=1 Tax=Pseudomonas sp. TaxID=306 RepID=UPI0025806E00|nr:hypothetical protein [Pseudomonas sp.]
MSRPRRCWEFHPPHAENHTVVDFSLLEDGIRAAASVMTAYRYYAVELLIGELRKIQKPHRARPNIAMTA